MKFIKMEDGMVITFLPLPKDTSLYYKEYKGFYINNFFYSDDSDLHNMLISIIFKNRNILNTSIFRKYLIVGLLNDELILTNIGYKLFQKINECSPLMNDNFEFKKLNVIIKNVDSSIGSLPSFDNSYFTEDYYPIKYKNINDYINSLSNDEINCIENFINFKSLTNQNNIIKLEEIFNKYNIGDIKTLIRTYKLNKIKNKCLN